jgi:DNA polymerase I-like protein with 3'-5' exonuclease and polymerase domains
MTNDIIIDSLNYSQMELRVMASFRDRKFRPFRPRKLAPGNLRTCSFLAFAHAYGELEVGKDDIHLATAEALVGRKMGRTTAMAINFAMIYGGRTPYG